MALTALDKGKRKDSPETHEDLSESHSGSSSASSSEPDTSSESESEDEITPEYLESLLEKARKNAASRSMRQTNDDVHEDDIIKLSGSTQEWVHRSREHPYCPDLPRPLPSLDPGKLPPPYFELGKSRHESLLSVRDPDIERAVLASSSFDVPAPPIPPPELTKSGKPLTKKEKKAVRVFLMSSFAWTFFLRDILGSSKIWPPGPIGLTSLLLQRLIYHGCTEK
jgi:hypothetical protein